MSNIEEKDFTPVELIELTESDILQPDEPLLEIQDNFVIEKSVDEILLMRDIERVIQLFKEEKKEKENWIVI
tara:strand:+ start:439 stop:654 length:216 start_codon:yes stop_codon:yes gene_type:complete